MKHLFLFVASLFAMTVFSQGRINVSVAPDDKITMHGFCYWQELFVKSKDTSFNYKLHSGAPDMLKNIKPGAYTLYASSVLGNRVKKKVSVSAKSGVVKLKGLGSFYKRVDATVNLCKKLRSGDTLVILYSSTSNESDREKIAVTFNKITGYKAIQYKGLTNEVLQEIGFREAVFKDLIEFEEKGKKANSPKAETAPQASVYTICLKKEIVSFIIPGDEGLNGLKAKLFIIENK